MRLPAEAEQVAGHQGDPEDPDGVVAGLVREVGGRVCGDRGDAQRESQDSVCPGAAQAPRPPGHLPHHLKSSPVDPPVVKRAVGAAAQLGDDAVQGKDAERDVGRGAGTVVVASPDGPPASR